MSLSRTDATPARSICVFCGSSTRHDPEMLASRRASWGALVVARGYGLVYGGREHRADGAGCRHRAPARRQASIGVMPDFLVAKEIAHRGLSELKITTSMHERKDVMASLADGFIALPGGFGTLEELLRGAHIGAARPACEAVRPAQHEEVLRLPAGLYRHCRRASAHCAPGDSRRVLVASDADSLLDLMQAYTAPCCRKWIDTANLFI